MTHSGLSAEQLSRLITDIKDWQINHGMLLRYGPSAAPIGVSVFPTSFPKKLFEHAQRLQPVFNRLYAAISEDDEWLGKALKGLIKEEGSFAAILWKIHQDTKEEGYLQNITLGLFRSDYMLHVEEASGREANDSSLGLRQIEFNTYSVAGGAHANKAADMHRHMMRTGNYLDLEHEDYSQRPTESTIPENTTVTSLAASLKAAHAAYGEAKSLTSRTPGVLFVVQQRNVNICDERPLEYALQLNDPPIPVFRIEFGAETLAHTSISPDRALIYQHSSLPTAVEVAVVYMRAGYDYEEYTATGIAARLQLERSCAIKCPSILCHLATFKKVQQELAVPGALGRFLSPEDAAAVSKTFARMYPVDGESKDGQVGRDLALDPTTAVQYVLKPSLEGGGHNIYRDKIPHFLRTVPESQWHTYILMEMVRQVERNNILLTQHGTWDEAAAREAASESENDSENDSSSSERMRIRGGPTVSELGIFGFCMWRKAGNSSPHIISNSEAGWSFKTKPKHVNEMSVVKGFGCFDSPVLVDSL